MFYWCGKLRFIDLSFFDINNINNKFQMFGLSSFDASNELYVEAKKKIIINENSLEEFKKQISSKNVEIIPH